MKIIGETKDGYIVQMTKDEAARAAGFHGQYCDDWRKIGAGIGTEINFTAAISYHSRIRQHEGDAKRAAGILRALAEMIDGALPEVVIPEEAHERGGEPV